MFIGHFGVALAAKKFAPKTSLGTLFAAAEFLDLLWPAFLLLGWEHARIAPGITRVQPLDFYDYPISHSLLMTVVWSSLAGAAYYAVRRDAGGAKIVGILVASHWVLDFVVHRPDLPLWPGGPLAGLGLWNSWVASLFIEFLIFAAGVWTYLKSGKARDGIGRYAFWSLMAFLLFGWLGAVFGPPPPSLKVLEFGALVIWLYVLWGWWADAHRETVS